MLKLHHVGLAVENISKALPSYEKIFGSNSISDVYNICSQNVRVCFVKVGSDTYVELVEPSEENSLINGLLKKGVTYYHVGYKTKTFNESIEKLKKEGFVEISVFNSEAFQGKRCAFMVNRSAHLFELIEE